jgi:hypothetical protein
MIGLSFLIGIVIWVTLASMLSIRIPHWVGMTKHTMAASVLMFPLVLTVPFADELIGRWQFYRLCDREAVVTLSPGWEKVKRAKREWMNKKKYEGYLIPIDSQGLQYIDRDTGKIFMSNRALFTNGGFLRRHLYGLNGQATSCHPENGQAIEKQLNLSELLK